MSGLKYPAYPADNCRKRVFCILYGHIKVLRKYSVRKHNGKYNARKITTKAAAENNNRKYDGKTTYGK